MTRKKYFFLIFFLICSFLLNACGKQEKSKWEVPVLPNALSWGDSYEQVMDQLSEKKVSVEDTTPSDRRDSLKTCLVTFEKQEETGYGSCSSAVFSFLPLPDTFRLTSVKLTLENCSYDEVLQKLTDTYGEMENLLESQVTDPAELSASAKFSPPGSGLSDLSKEDWERLERSLLAINPNLATEELYDTMSFYNLSLAGDGPVYLSVDAHYLSLLNLSDTESS